MRLRKIKIENVRGISLKEIVVDIHPNTPTFLLLLMDLGKHQLQLRLIL